MKLLFITATPLNIVEGSGTFAGIHVLAHALEQLGVTVDFATPGSRIRNFTLRRLWFNERLRGRRVLDYDAIVKQVHNVSRRQCFHLIESFAGAIADDLLEAFPQAIEARVCVRKLELPEWGPEACAVAVVTKRTT